MYAYREVSVIAGMYMQTWVIRIWDRYLHNISMYSWLVWRMGCERGLRIEVP